MHYKVSDSESPEVVRGDSNLPRLVQVLALLSIALVLSAAVILFLVLTGGGSARISHNSNADALISQRCDSEQCVRTAAQLLDSLDQSADPCEDFYQFACGHWSRHNPMPEAHASWSQFQALHESLHFILKEFIEDETLANDVTAVKKVRSFYKSCNDIDTLEKLGVASLMKPVLNRLHLTPSLPKVASPAFDWLYTEAVRRRLLGNSALWKLSVQQAILNSSVHSISIDQTSLDLNERVLLDPDKYPLEISEYRRYVATVLGLLDSHLSAEANETLVEEMTDQIVDFNVQLAGIMVSAEERRLHGQSLIVQVMELQSATDRAGPNQIDWERYLKLVFKDTNVTLNLNVPPPTPGSDSDENDRIREAWNKGLLGDTVTVAGLPYLMRLVELLNNTEPLILERFLWWRAASRLAPFTLAEFRTAQFDFGKAVMGLQREHPRWQTCLESVLNTFGFAISHLYVRAGSFPGPKRQQAMELLELIRWAFEESLRENDWMDAETKRRAREKAQQMHALVGYPEWVLDTAKLDQYYQDKNVTEGEFFRSLMKLLDAEIRSNLEKLHEGTDRLGWVSTATNINAFYAFFQNSITFPAGLLQSPFYGLGIEALNFGAIGAIMGHEMSHGFDDQGRRFDANGEFSQWWTNATLSEFEQRASCFIRQYASYWPQRLGHRFPVNGVLTLGENIADNGGLRQAWRAFVKYQANQEDDVRLPALGNYTQKQLFFLGYSHMWCSSETIGSLRKKLLVDSHAPNRFRVIGSLSNMKEFSEAFNCPAGSKMNPAMKCVLW